MAKAYRFWRHISPHSLRPAAITNDLGQGLAPVDERSLKGLAKTVDEVRLFTATAALRVA